MNAAFEAVFAVFVVLILGLAAVSITWAIRRGRTAPDRTAPDRTARDRTAPDRTAPDRSAPDRSAPDRAARGPHETGTD